MGLSGILVQGTSNCEILLKYSWVSDTFIHLSGRKQTLSEGRCFHSRPLRIPTSNVKDNKQ